LYSAVKCLRDLRFVIRAIFPHIATVHETGASSLLITQQPAVITGLVYREQMGQLDLTEAGPDGAAPVVEPPYDLTAIAGENAAEILNASLRAEAKAADLGLVASVMMVDAEGRIWADFVDSALAYGAPPVTAPASGAPCGG
jgi:hypothetical protein